MSVLPIGTNGSDPYPDTDKNEAVALVQSIFEILAEGRVTFRWEEQPEMCRASASSNEVTVMAGDKVDTSIKRSEHERSHWQLGI